MKIILISRNQNLTELIKNPLEKSGINIICYTNALKAIDNFREIDPDVVLFDAQDFPRHWKLGLQFLRDFRTRQEAVFLLLTPPDYPDSEIEKAAYLEVNGLVEQSDDDKLMTELILNLIRRYKALEIPKDHQRKNLNGAALMFLNPRSLSLVKGEVVNQSEDRFLIKIREPWLIQDLESEDILEECSLKIDSNIINTDFVVKDTPSGYHLLLESISSGEVSSSSLDSSLFTA